uniref:Uncharacterized protein n=1 Tax=Globisporangium ultimum (strain ATCC 200006 / CBS 805.95 / DAOM BR144) TaxID=431595 RepID=K3WI53_GLOUD
MMMSVTTAPAATVVALSQAHSRKAARSHRRRYCARALLIAVLVLVAVAATGSADATEEVEIRVEDFSFSDELEENPTIAIEVEDIKGSELLKKPVRTKSYREFQRRNEAPKHQGYNGKKKKVARPPSLDTVRSDPYLTLELSTQEQAMVIVVVVCGLFLVALIVVSAVNLVQFVWHYVQEQRTLRRLFVEYDMNQLASAISKYPATSSLLIRQVAMVRLRHLQFVYRATELVEKLQYLSFDANTLELTGVPNAVGTKKEMTLLELFDTLEHIRCTGDQLVIEMMQISVPSRWKRYVDTSLWLAKHDECIQRLHAEAVKVQQLSTCVSDTLMSKLQAGEAIEKATFVHLLSALRQSSTVTSTTMSSDDTSNSSTSSSASSIRNRFSASRDEYSFFVKAFDEINEQHQVKRELHAAVLSYEHSVKTTRTTKSDGSESPDSVADLSEQDHNKELLARKLEKFVDRAENLGVTHFEEVERAQYALENTRRENFCAAIFNNDAKVLENVESLAMNFVRMGADHKGAVLKAGEILANRSNTMLLVNSLRGMFDELRKQEMIKMNERRKHDAAKQMDKRERMSEKFRLKQQLVVEKLELMRQAQQQQEENERLKQEAAETEAWRKQMKAARKQFVWMVTKVDLLIVLLVMALAFFESLRQFAFIKPVCPPGDTQYSGVLSSMFGATNSLAVLGCQVAYGAKMAAILLVLAFAFFLLAQFNLLVVVLPTLLAAVLYHVRAEWMNMLFRMPLLAVIYGFNSTCLYLLNRSGEEGKHVATTRMRALFSYFVFPLASVLLSGLIGIGIACDDPQQCASTAVAFAGPVLSSVAEVAREAYGM